MQITILFPYSQELFHTTTHWLKACGVLNKFADDYTNKERFIPLPKANNNKPLVAIQLMMLWLIWGSGLIVGIFLFLVELASGQVADHLKRREDHNTSTMKTQLMSRFPTTLKDETPISEDIHISELE